MPLTRVDLTNRFTTFPQNTNTVSHTVSAKTYRGGNSAYANWTHGRVIIRGGSRQEIKTNSFASLPQNTQTKSSFNNRFTALPQNTNTVSHTVSAKTYRGGNAAYATWSHFNGILNSPSNGRYWAHRYVLLIESTQWTGTFEADGVGTASWVNKVVHFAAFNAAGVAAASFDGRRQVIGRMSANGVATAVFKFGSAISGAFKASGVATAQFHGAVAIFGHFECDGVAGNIVFITFSNGVPIEGLISSLPPATFPAGASVGVLFDSPHSY